MDQPWEEWTSEDYELWLKQHQEWEDKNVPVLPAAEPVALELFYKRAFSALMKFCHRRFYGLDKHEHEDICSEAVYITSQKYVPLPQRYIKPDYVRGFIAYSTRVAYYIGLKYYRKLRRVKLYDSTYFSSIQDDLSEPDYSNLYRAIESLDPRRAAIVRQFYLDDLTDREIAQQLNMTLGSVSRQRHIAIRQLRMAIKASKAA